MSLENMEKMKYFAVAVTNKKCIQKFSQETCNV